MRVVDVTLGPNFTVTPVEGTERELPADLVLLAIGFGGTEPSPPGIGPSIAGGIDVGAALGGAA